MVCGVIDQGSILPECGARVDKISVREKGLALVSSALECGDRANAWELYVSLLFASLQASQLQD